MESFTLFRDDEPNLRFKGEEIASANSQSHNSTRWTILKLYKTQAGKFICQTIGRTQWQGENDRYSAAVADDEAGVIAFFGHGWLAKELYGLAGIIDAQDVE